MEMISTPKATTRARVGKQRAADAGDEQRHQDGRERQHHVAHAHQERVEPAAEKAGQQAEHDADDHRQHHRDDADDQRDARAVDHGREDVAALVVGAEQVFGSCPRRSRRAAGGRR
jgi:hypothetical protein